MPDLSPDALASARLDGATWATLHDELVTVLRDLIRIPSINPPNPPGPELDVALHLADLFRREGLAPEVIEPVPGRGTITLRLKGDGTGGDPFLLFTHLDVVPANAADGWTHDPFAADIADGYIWGRGAVDMKAMVAMSTLVVVILARRARAAGLDPATDPIPGLRRDLMFTCSADEETGGGAGADWLVIHRPDTLQAGAAVNEAGAVSIELAGRRFYPIQVAEKGLEQLRILVHGTWGHGSMPRDDNAAVRAATVVTRLATPGEPRLTAPMRAFLDGIAAAVPPDAARLITAITAADGDPKRAEAALASLCDPMYARAIRALLRDSISPDVIHAGVKVNIIPGEAVLEVDCRTLPGTTHDDVIEEIRARMGDLAEHCEIETIFSAPAVEAPTDTELFRLMCDVVRAHDPEGIPLPVIAPFSTDAKSAARLGVPTYGFSPLRLEPGERFLERFHGVDERVGLDALRWGLPVLYDVTCAYCE